MSFTVLKQPGRIMPVYNEITFHVSDTAYAQPKFKYNFILSVNGAVVNTSKLYPRPDGTCIYSPNRILQQYVSGLYMSDIPNVREADSKEISRYNLQITVEYEVGGNLTEFLRYNSGNNYVWNGAAQWPDRFTLESTYVADLMPTDLNTSLMNHLYYGTSWEDGMTLYESDKHVISFFRYNASLVEKVKRMRVQVWNPSGGYKMYVRNFNAPVDVTNGKAFVLHVPVGINELNGFAWTSRTIPPGYSNEITLAEDVGMKVQFEDLDGTILMKKMYFRFEPDCPAHKTDHIRLDYRTSNGGYNSVSFDKKHYRLIENSKALYDKPIYYSYDASRRGTVAFANVSTESWELNTDWIMGQERFDEIADLSVSPDIYLKIGGESYPVHIEKISAQHRRYNQDDMQSFSITVSSSYPKISVR